MVGRGLLLTVIAMISISFLVMKNISSSTNEQNDNVVRYYQSLVGRNMAQTGINLALRKMAYNPKFRTTFTQNLTGGSVSVSFKDTFFLGRSTVKISATSKIPYDPSRIIYRRDSLYSTVAFVPRGLLPGGNSIRGAITSNMNVDGNGNSTVDGRDHDTSGNYIPLRDTLQGTWAIWSTHSVTPSGNLKLGGTTITPSDLTPTKTNADTAVYRENQVYPGGFPTTPDSIMGGPKNGFTPGMLKAIAQSGFGGSQYSSSVTPTLTTPLKGVTYIECNGQWLGPDITGSGILVIHTSTFGASVKLPTGTFRGIVIADDIDKMHGDIIGAVVVMKTNPPSGNVIGNGGGNVYYSSDAILNSVATVKADSLVSTYTNQVLGWWE